MVARTAHAGRWYLMRASAQLAIFWFAPRGRHRRVPPPVTGANDSPVGRKSHGRGSCGGPGLVPTGSDAKAPRHAPEGRSNAAKT
jgi:hypothetical protein